MKQEDYPKKIWVQSYFSDDTTAGVYADDKGYHHREHIPYIREDLVPQWHKYPDEKPSEDGWYLISAKETQTDKPSVFISQYYSKEFKGIALWFAFNIVAWMELPKPYKEN